MRDKINVKKHIGYVLLEVFTVGALFFALRAGAWQAVIPGAIILVLVGVAHVGAAK